MMELMQLKVRQLDLAQRQPVGTTSVGVGMRWMLEGAQLLTDIADYTLRTARVSESK